MDTNSIITHPLPHTYPVNTLDAQEPQLPLRNTNMCILSISLKMEKKLLRWHWRASHSTKEMQWC